MRPEFGELTVVMTGHSGGESITIRQALVGCGIRGIHLARSPEAFLHVCRAVTPDVGIIVLAVSDKSGQGLRVLKELRKEAEGNRYLPVIVAQNSPCAAIVRTAINTGAHEFLSLPASLGSLSRLIYRAVFISRPFIVTPGYAGPCRRRRQLKNLPNSERRLAPWPGYIHAAHRDEELTIHNSLKHDD